jgi:glucose/arabinose dehydrogenase
LDPEDEDPEGSCEETSGTWTPDSGTGSSTEGTGEDTTPPTAVDLEPVVEGLDSPVDVAFPQGAKRLYVATQPGEVLAYGSKGCHLLLDLRDEVVVGTEQGLLGIEPHPEFETNRRLFVRYSSPAHDGTPEEYSHTFVLSEFAVDDDGRRADEGSEQPILELPQPQDTHNAGDIAFGPDGYLYVTTGDGGGHVDADPGHAEDWYETNDGGNGQDVTENLLGSILRIDVDEGPEDQSYGIPPDNPLVGEAGRDEQYAWGFRNPWRLSFDGEDLFVADVGKWRIEEVNLVEKGGNYGWNVREGTECFDTDEPTSPREDCPDSTPPDVRGGEPLLDPIIEYFHGDDPERVTGISVIGGVVYRGDAVAGLRGRYVFGDFQPNGRLFVATPPRLDDAADGWEAAVLPLADGAAERLDRLLSLERGPGGELYVLGGGAVHRLVSVEGE